VPHLGVVEAVHDEHEVEGGDVADLVEAPRDPRLQRQTRCRRSLRRTVCQCCELQLTQ